MEFMVFLFGIILVFLCALCDFTFHSKMIAIHLKMYVRILPSMYAINVLLPFKLNYKINFITEVDIKISFI